MRRSLSTVPLALLLLVVMATPAFAHATFDVTQLPAGSTLDVTLRVPLERDAVNDLVEVLVPGVFTIDACDATEGWDCRQDATQEGDTVVTLTRRADGPGDAERFALTMTAPTEEGVYTFPTIQTYDDGEEVGWVNDPGTDNPAPRIQVGDATTEVESAGDASPHTPLASTEPAEPASTPTEAPTAAEEQPTDAPVEGADEPSDAPRDAPTEPDDTADGTDTVALDEGGEEGSPTPWVPIVIGLGGVVAGTAFTLSRRG